MKGVWGPPEITLLKSTTHLALQPELFRKVIHPVRPWPVPSDCDESLGHIWRHATAIITTFRLYYLGDKRVCTGKCDYESLHAASAADNARTCAPVGAAKNAMYKNLLPGVGTRPV
jgi:hypothetical protein